MEVAPNPALGRAEALLRAGTEILRTGGGAYLSSGQCNALLDKLARVDALERENEQLDKDLKQSIQWRREWEARVDALTEALTQMLYAQEWSTDEVEKFLAGDMRLSA